MKQLKRIEILKKIGIKNRKQKMCKGMATVALCVLLIARNLSGE